MSEQYKPMSAPKQITYYDYFADIQPKLCDYIGIKEEHFRNYHKVVGGEYKDFWHTLLNILRDNFKGNDSYFTMYHQGDTDSNTFDNLDEYYTKVKMQGDEYGLAFEWQEHRSWSRPLYDAIDKLHEEFGAEIIVWISW